MSRLDTDSWKVLARETLVDQPPFLVVEQHTLALPDGRVIPAWQWVITPDGWITATYPISLAVPADLPSGDYFGAVELAGQPRQARP